MLFIGLMSGTSCDGVDAVLAAFSEHGARGLPVSTDKPSCPVTIHQHVFVPMPPEVRREILRLNAPESINELHRVALLGLSMADLYAQAVEQLLAKAGIRAQQVSAIGAHGQTIRHQPQQGYTVQVLNAARLAQKTGIDVVADFRARDVAAGGQGAPFAPLFHQAFFSDPDKQVVVANIGGMANISVLAPNAPLMGCDTGPGNVLMDAWVHRHLGQTYDADGTWAAQGQVNSRLLHHMMATEPWFQAPAPKSTGREQFNLAWLQERLDTCAAKASPVDVQATLCALTAQSLVAHIAQLCPRVDRLVLCGGGAYNPELIRMIKAQLEALAAAPSLKRTSHGTEQQGGRMPELLTSQHYGMAAEQLEALGFAWLAQAFKAGKRFDMRSVTGAAGSIPLGALYPA